MFLHVIAFVHVTIHTKPCLKVCEQISPVMNCRGVVLARRLAIFLTCECYGIYLPLYIYPFIEQVSSRWIPSTPLDESEMKIVINPTLIHPARSDTGLNLHIYHYKVAIHSFLRHTLQAPSCRTASHMPSFNQNVFRRDILHHVL